MHSFFPGILLTLTCLSALAAAPQFRVQTIAGSNFSGDGGPATQAILQQAEGVAVDPSGALFIADAATHRIRAVSPSGEIRTIAGDGSPGLDGDGGPALKAHLNSPYGLSLDRQGNLYIADLGNARVRVISPDGLIRTVAGGGDLPAGDSSEGSPATSLRLKSPRNVLADFTGGFYLSDFDGHRVYYVDSRGILTIFAGTGNPGYGADNIAAVRSALRNPAGLALDPFGGVIIVESGSQRLRRVIRGAVAPYLADALRAYPLYSPTGIAFDSAGNTYLADARSTGALKRTPQGEIAALPLSGRAVAADPRGGAVYASSTIVYRVDAANKVTFAAGTANDITGDNGTADSARLLAPSAVAYDREGNLYIADERAHRVRRVTLAGLITTFAGIGKPAYTGDGGPAAKAGLNAPRGLAFDATGNLYIADSANHAIRVISPSGTINTLSGNGFPGFQGDGGPAASALLNSPSAVAIHPANADVLIADTANHRIRRIGSNRVITTFAAGQLNAPQGLAFDQSGTLYIADTGNNRVSRVDIAGVATTIGEANFSAPRAVAAASDGSLYVADTGNSRIAQITGNTTTIIAGAGTPGFSGDGGPALEALFQSPAALALDPAGNISVADLGNGRVRQLHQEVLLFSGLESPLTVTNAASGFEGPIAPDMLVTLFGESLLPAETARVEVRVDGQPTQLLYVSSRQINLRIPSLLNRDSALIEVYANNVLRAKTTTPVTASAPGLFAKIIQEDGTLNSATNPASRGSIVTLFATGTGAAPADTYQVRIGEMQTQILWAGPMPGVPGVTQINLRLPSGFFSAGSLPVSFRANTAAAPGGLFVFLQ